MIITDKAQIKIAELKESNNLRLLGSDDLECYELLESDLKLPADATFTRSSVAYLSDGTQVDANMPRFEQGRFGKAIMVEEGTTNIITNPSFESGISGIGTYSSNGTPVCSQDNTGLVGTKSLKIETVADTSLVATWLPAINVVAGNTYTFSCYTKEYPYANKNIYLGLSWRRTDNSVITSTDGTQISASSNWKRLHVTGTAPTEAVKVYCYIYIVGTIAAGDTQWIDAAQLEQKPYATSFIDGTRAAETLTIPTAGVLNPQEGTIEFVLIPNYASSVVPASGYGFTDLGFLNRNSCSGFLIRRRQNAIDLIIGTGTTYEHYSYTINWNAKEQLALAVKWDLDNTFVLLKGQRVITAPKFNTVNLPSSLMIGNRHDDVLQAGNALYDDLRISNRARSDEEIFAVYQSGQLLLVDEWTTYKLDFDDKVRITTQGQIICNELIEI